LMAGSVTQVHWQTPSGVTVESVALLHSLDGGSTWSLIARGQPNTGTYDWTVPNVGTDQAKVAVVLVESADKTGDLVDGVLGVSDRFVIAAALGVGETRFGLALQGPVPNPSRNLSVSFTLPGAGPATLAVYDLSGREVSWREVGSLGAGRHVVSVSASGTHAPGIYLVHLIQGERR